MNAAVILMFGSLLLLGAALVTYRFARDGVVSAEWLRISKILAGVAAVGFVSAVYVLATD